MIYRPNIPLHQTLLNNNVNYTPALEEDVIREWGELPNNILNHYNSYLHQIVQGGSLGPIEKHPYMGKYSHLYNLNDKFLILGTFPPNSYFNNLGLNGLPNDNITNRIPTDFYYGNRNFLWKYLFDLEDEIIDEENIINNLIKNKISITDVYSFLQRKIMKKSDDGQFRNILLNNNIAKIFHENSSIDTIIFTSGSLARIYNADPNATRGFYWILSDCFPDLEGLKISGVLNGNGPYHHFNNFGVSQSVEDQAGGIIWWIKKGEKKIRLINPPSPGIGIAIPNSTFFLRWVNRVANEKNILPPNEEETQNLMAYCSNYPEFFHNPITIQYKKDIYSRILNGTIINI